MDSELADIAIVKLADRGAGQAPDGPPPSIHRRRGRQGEPVAHPDRAPAADAAARQSVGRHDGRVSI